MSNVKFVYKDYLDVVDMFVSCNDNRTKTIAKNLKLSLAKTSYLIDVYLSLKSNYMGEKINMPKSPFKYRNTALDNTSKHSGKCKRVSLYENDNFLGTFDSIYSACNFLGVSYESTKRLIYNKTNYTINHSKIKRKITYKKEYEQRLG